MEPLYDVVRVTPRSDHTLEREFENGETRLCDMPLFSAGNRSTVWPRKNMPTASKASPGTRWVKRGSRLW